MSQDYQSETMGELEILHTLVKLFDRFHLSYLLTGGYAVTYYGEPRATNDIDFIVEVTKDSKKSILEILNILSSDFIVDKQFVSEIGGGKTEFNIIHADTGLKIDFWVIAKSDFLDQFQRRQIQKIAGEKVVLVSPEDLILTKLSWCKDIFSERHFNDCVGIWQVQQGKLDTKYLTSRAQKLGIAKLLNKVMSA